MPWLWSNPVPDQHTSSDLSANYKVDAPSIGFLMSAIMRYREQQQQQQQQQMNNMMSALGKYQQQGQANDAANAAIYGAQYPNDAMSAFTDPGRVPDYGGTSALQAYEAAQKLNPNGFAAGNAPQLVTHTDENGNTYLLEGNHWTHIPNQNNSEIMNERRAQELWLASHKNNVDSAQQNLANIVGYDDPSSVLSAVAGYQPGKTPFPLLQGNSTPGETKQQLIDAANQLRTLEGQQMPTGLQVYQNMINNRPATTYVPGMGGIEGGRYDAQGNPITTIQQAGPGNPVTLAVHPGDPRFGTQGVLVQPNGSMTPAAVTDKGPGVKNIDIASNDKTMAYNTPPNLANSKYVASKPGQAPSQELIDLAKSHIQNGTPPALILQRMQQLGYQVDPSIFQ